MLAHCVSIENNEHFKGFTFNQKRLGFVHTSLEKFENAALFPRLDLPSTLITRTEDLKTSTLCFGVDEKHFEHGAFRAVNDDVSCHDCGVFKFLRPSVDRVVFSGIS